jgi:hypothetical protein
MCVILDTNTFGRFRNPKDENLQPVHKWLREKNGRIVYSNTEKYKTEWKKGGMEHWIKERAQNRAGQFRLVSDGVQEKESELKGKIKSDDEHIIALALVTGVKVLISYSEYESGQKGDSDLFDDFKNKNLVGGKVYTKKSHARRMLTKDTCP